MCFDSIVRVQRNSLVGMCTIISVPYTQCRYEDEERCTCWPETEVFACLLTKNSANALGTDSLDVYSWRLHCATMVEINVERENSRSHNPRSYNPIGSTVSMCCIPKRSRLGYRLSFKTLHLSSLSRFLSVCIPFALAPIAKSYPQ